MCTGAARYDKKCGLAGREGVCASFNPSADDLKVVLARTLRKSHS